MNDKEIRNATASILKEYMEWAGYITPSDFILIREQARKEIANGVHFNTECDIKNEITIPPKKKQEIKEEYTTQEKPAPKESQEEVIESVKENKPQKEDTQTKKQMQQTVAKKEPIKESRTVRTYEKKKEKSDFEILKGLKDEWN